MKLPSEKQALREAVEMLAALGKANGDRTPCKVKLLPPKKGQTIEMPLGD